jgi:capsular exopolysaccharide synthesis family protein
VVQLTRSYNTSSAASDGKTSNDVDFSLITKALLRYLPLLLLIGALAGIVTYVYSRSKPPVYRASAVVLATNGQGGNAGIINQTLVTAPPLPDGAAEQALKSSAVTSQIVSELARTADIRAVDRTELVNKLRQQITRNQISSLQLIPQTDPYGNGLYTIQADAGTANAARVLADTAAKELIAWDAGRASEGIVQSAKVLRAQIADVDARLRSTATGSVERQTLVSSRASLEQNLARTTILISAATGTLKLVSPASVPYTPIAPRPVREGALAALLTLLAGAALVSVRTLTDKTVKSEDDLLDFGLPTLGTLPRLRRRDILRGGLLSHTSDASLYESIGFMRVNLLSMFQHQPHLRLTISSTAPGEGKSSVTAALADAFGTAGKRVLIIDGDLRRSTQETVWGKQNVPREWCQLAGTGGARNLQEALKDPANVQVLKVEPNVDLLPAGPGIQESLIMLSQLDLPSILTRWEQDYDIVLVDSPPVLALADGLVLAKHTHGIILVTEARRTSMHAVRAALRRAERAGANVLGFAINKIDTESGSEYNYSYSYAPKNG